MLPNPSDPGHSGLRQAASEWVSWRRCSGVQPPPMLRRYAASTADERARDAHRRHGLGARL
jgi:hypothetical protein